MKNYEYQNFSTLLFQGFYESSLMNGDVLWTMTENDRGSTTIDENGNEVPILADDEEYDFVGDNYKKFKLDVCSQASYLLRDNLEIGQDIIKDIKFRNLSSPTYYNYTTDKLNLLIDVDLRKLKKFCFTTYSKEFNKYLFKHWSSRSGFCSFVPSTLTEFKNEYKNGDRIEHDRCLNVMIEYYLLCNINNTRDCDYFDNDNSYQYQLIEYADQCLWQYIEPVKV